MGFVLGAGMPSTALIFLTTSKNAWTIAHAHARTYVLPIQWSEQVSAMSAWVRGRNLIDVGSGLGRGIEKRTAPPLSKMLALLSGHLSLRCQVHLVGDQHYVDENIYE